MKTEAPEWERRAKDVSSPDFVAYSAWTLYGGIEVLARVHCQMTNREVERYDTNEVVDRGYVELKVKPRGFAKMYRPPLSLTCGARLVHFDPTARLDWSGYSRVSTHSEIPFEAHFSVAADGASIIYPDDDPADHSMPDGYDPVKCRVRLRKNRDGSVNFAGATIAKVEVPMSKKRDDSRGISQQNSGLNSGAQTVSGDAIQIISGSHTTDIRESFNKSAGDGDEQERAIILLEELKALLAELAKEAPGEADRISRDFDSFVKEAADPNPRKPHMNLGAKGLIGAARTCQRLVEPVTKTIKSIYELLNLGDLPPV
jgi:hypothetical protein